MPAIITDLPGFRVIKHLGHSCYTDVWLAEQLSLRRLVTLKVLSEEFAGDVAESARFKAEAKIASGLKYRSIVQIYDFAEYDGRPVVVMEYVTGPSVAGLMAEGGSVAPEDVVSVGIEVAAALAYAWRNHALMHGHITPKSIYLDETGDQAVKLAYMGLSLRVDTLHPDRAPPDARIDGTPFYMAPELVTATGAVDCHADMYALGATLYHMLTGKVPFGDLSPHGALQGHVDGHIVHPRRFVRDLPPGVGRLLEKLLMKDPARRFADWEEACAMLKTCLTTRKAYVHKGTLEGCTLAAPNAVPRKGPMRPIVVKKGMPVAGAFPGTAFASESAVGRPASARLDSVAPIAVSQEHDREFDGEPDEQPDAEPTRLRERLLAGELLMGTWVQIGNAVSSEILAQAGFDWMAADMEHTDIDVATFTQLARGVYGRGPEMWARVRENDTLAIRQVLDAGAQGVIVPLVNSAAEARQAVAAARFPPDGVRGFSFSRANDWGRQFDAYAEQANADISVVVMIESQQACKEIDAIMAVDGVDAAFIGPYDLSGSMGVPGQTDHPAVRAACARVVQSCALAGKSAGIHIVKPDPAAIERAIEEGFRLIALGMDTVFIAEGARHALAAARGG